MLKVVGEHSRIGDAFVAPPLDGRATVRQIPI
jgi:hypothetical protein